MSDSCGSRIYRYTGPGLVMNPALGTVATANGYQWSFVGNLYNSATIDSGSLTSQVIRIRYSSNNAAQPGDSVKLAFTSACGIGIFRAVRLSNRTKTGCPAIPISKMSELPVTKTEELPANHADNIAKFDVRVFPNPTVSSFKVNVVAAPSLNGRIQLRILDLNGREMKKGFIYKDQVAQMGSDLRPGIYFIEARVGKNVKVVRLIKQ